MASRKLVRDLLMTNKPLFRQLTHQQRVGGRLGFIPANGTGGHRWLSVLNDFSNKIKGEVDSNPEFKQTVKELKEKAEELKGVTEDLKVRTKVTSEQLYKQVDGVWTDAEAAAKKVSSSMKETLSAATEEVKESFKLGKEENAGSASSSKQQQTESGTSEAQQTLFGIFKSSVCSPKVSEVFHKIKEVKALDFARKGLDIVKDELRGNPSKKKHLEYTPPPPFTGVKSTRTDVVVTPVIQSKWQKKWESLREKMQDYPVFKRLGGMTEPVVNKSQEIAEDVREMWETSDSPIVHKIQDINESIFLETNSAATYKEIRSRDPSFSLPDFATEVHGIIKPVLNAFFVGDTETLKKYCSKEVIERCMAEHKAYKTGGYFFDNKLLHISEVHVDETKMMGTTPIINVAFETQEVYCVRDQNGEIKEGGQDTIHRVHYVWAMQQVEAGEDALHPIWRLRDIMRMGVAALI